MGLKYNREDLNELRSFPVDKLPCTEAQVIWVLKGTYDRGKNEYTTTYSVMRYFEKVGIDVSRKTIRNIMNQYAEESDFIDRERLPADVRNRIGVKSGMINGYKYIPEKTVNYREQLLQKMKDNNVEL